MVELGSNKWKARRNLPKGKTVIPIYLFLFFITVGLGVLLITLSANDEEPFTYDDEGVPKISEERKAKLKYELEKLDQAEQYALLAEVSGWFPCFNCPDTTHIFLVSGEVWKYGVTTNGRNRYSPGFYTNNRLVYFPQFRGPLQECLKEEKRKIYYYPVLPENLKRKIRILRPPGNKKDS